MRHGRMLVAGITALIALASCGGSDPTDPSPFDSPELDAAAADVPACQDAAA